jgi:hypothetical protein
VAPVGSLTPPIAATPNQRDKTQAVHAPPYQRRIGGQALRRSTDLGRAQDLAGGVGHYFVQAAVVRA